MTILIQLLRNKKALVGVTILAIVILVAIFAPLLTEYSPTQRVGRPHQPPSADHLLGTTRLGYDVFTRLLYGARISLAVGFGAGLLITVIGTVLGIISGYKGGVVDEVITFLTNMVLVIPNLPLLLVLAAFIGQASPLVIAVILGFTSWAWGVRVTRSETLSIRQRDFVKSAEMLGEPGWRINFAIDEIANPRLRTGGMLARWTGLIRRGEGTL